MSMEADSLELGSPVYQCSGGVGLLCLYRRVSVYQVQCVRTSI